MRRWGIVLLLLASLGLNLGVIGMLAFEKARPKPPDPHPPDGPELAGAGNGDLIARLPRFANYLGLEGVERQRFLDIQVALFQETTRLRLRTAEIQRSLRLELTGEKPDPARTDKLLRDSAEVYLQLERAFVKSVLESRQLLGEKQEQRYLQVLARLRSTTRGQLGLAPGGEEGAAPGPPPRGLLRPLDRPGPRGRPGLQRFRQERQEAPPPWAEPLPEGATPQQRMQRLQWRRLQRERLLQQRRQQGPPPGQKPAPPPPPVY
jgi:hypothetical protein